MPKQKSFFRIDEPSPFRTIVTVIGVAAVLSLVLDLTMHGPVSRALDVLEKLF